MTSFRTEPLHLTEIVTRNCPACCHDQTRNRGAKNGFQLLRCLRCRSIFTAKVPLTAPDVLYADLDIQHAVHPESIVVRDSLARTISKFSIVRSVNRILDVGCGVGILLTEAAAQGWEAYGVDVSGDCVETARRRGFSVFHGEVHEATFPDNFFDVVCAVEVLEHVNDPAAVLREIHRVLRRGGVIWGTTPHASGLAARLLANDWSAVIPPNHLQLFSSPGMSTLLTSTGFQEIGIRSTMTNPVEIALVLARRVRGVVSGPRLDSRARYVATDADFSALRLNEFLSASRIGRIAKRVGNALLARLNLGDSLTFTARK